MKQTTEKFALPWNLVTKHLRLILELMDEVEQLREAVQWLRRQSGAIF